MQSTNAPSLARHSWIVAAALTLAACAGPQAPPDGGDTASRRIGNLEVRGVPDIPPELSARLRQYRNTRDARLQGWLGDGVLLATRFGDTTQLHRVAQPLGMRRQLTFFREPVAEAVVATQSDPDGFVYLRDVGGSENYQLFHYDLASGASTLRSDGHSRYTGVVWANGGDRFAYTTTERNGRDWDIHLQTVTGESQAILEAGGAGWMVEDFAPDDTHLLVSRYVSINESKLYELSLTDGSLSPLIGEDRRAAIRQAAYSPDGERVYFTSDLGAEFPARTRARGASACLPAISPGTWRSSPSRRGAGTWPFP